MSESIKTSFHRLFKVVTFSIERPQLINRLVLIITVLMCGFLPFASIDVDPENMLAEQEPARVFHNQMKQKMNINDLIVVGIENGQHPNGVFNPESLNRIFDFSENLKILHWTDADDGIETRQGVMTHNILSLNQVDAIESGGPGVIQFDRLMKEKIQSQLQADQILKRALDNPFLAGTMISQDHRSIALYIPISSKSVSSKIYDLLNNEITRLQGEETYYISGLPLAEDVFGIDMFIQMAISAPMAMGLIFALIVFFFRHSIIGLSALLVAMASVLITMGAFVAFGNTIHIMSSMIAIFLMPIAVLDTVHILSMFFDRYQQSRNRKQALTDVMNNLFTPMFYTSLTSAAGFFSLYFAPIPPIQVFGLFVGTGILIAWLLSMTLVPAYIMWLKPERLDSFAAVKQSQNQSPLSQALQTMAQFSSRHAKKIVFLFMVMTLGSLIGINAIKVNDNPMKWLAEQHPIRVADRFINDNFGGNYLAYLTFTQSTTKNDSQQLIETLNAFSLTVKDQTVATALQDFLTTVDINQTPSTIIDSLWQFTHKKIRLESERSSNVETQKSIEGELDILFDDSVSEKTKNPWQALQRFVSELRDSRKLFTEPEVLNYIAALQIAIEQNPLVGKSNSLSDLVKKLNKELHDADPDYETIPSSADQVSEVIVSFENSHEPFRIWHLVSRDFQTLNLWFQVKSGDNQDINAIVHQVEKHLIDNPPPIALSHQWFGLSYINTVWQQKMVSGMSSALIGSMIVVLIIMSLLFRSLIWGIISMIPLSITIAMIYGMIGLLGKDYDMPVAVLSALALGLAVDFAIHFISHAIELVKITGSWSGALKPLFNEPARAIYRNIIIIAVGFLPLLLAALVPYQTVGLLMATIMLLSGMATLIILPALLTLLQRQLFSAKTHGKSR